MSVIHEGKTLQRAIKDKKFFKGGISAFASALNVSRQVLYDDYFTKEKFSEDIKTKIETAINVSLTELVSDKNYAVESSIGLPDNFKNEAQLIGDHTSEDYYINKIGRVFQKIGEASYLLYTPRITQKAQAGFMMGWGDETYLEQLPTHPMVVRQPVKGFYISFDAQGNSMDDGTKEAISDGDILTGRRVDKKYWTSKLHFKEYPDFIIHHKDGLLVKRIIAHDVAKGIITCRSLNPDKKKYPDFDLSLSEIAQLFNIIQVTHPR